MVHSPFASAFVGGARFKDERGEIIEVSTRVVGDLDVPTGRLVVGDPFTLSFDDPPLPLSRSTPVGTFPVDVSIARFSHGDERVTCARVRLAGVDLRPVRWEPAAFEGTPVVDGEAPGYGVDAGTGCFFDVAARGEVDERTTEGWLAGMEKGRVNTWGTHVARVGKANVVMFSSGWGDGVYGSYWGLDAQDRVVELVTDFEVLLGPVSERIELELPIPRGKVDHALLAKHGVTMRVPVLSRRTVILGGDGAARIELSDGTPVSMRWKDGERYCTWEKAKEGARLVVDVMVGVKPLELAG